MTSNRVSQLEQDLIGQETQRQAEVESGGRRVREYSDWQKNAIASATKFGIKQGLRRRHPEHVLHQYREETGQNNVKAFDQWTQGMQENNERTPVDGVYRAEKDDRFWSNQMGLVTTALENYTNSKFKLERMHPVGV
jgi:hypothetical protein